MSEFFSSGSQLLDGVLGRGWPVGRLINIQGDSASGKTYLAEVAAANHLLAWPKGPVWYLDSEAAFDQEYAQRLKIPVEKINFLEDIFTVEDWYEQLMLAAEDIDSRAHGLMILDSLDALSDEAELSRKITEGSFGGNKAKKMSELFRRINATLSAKNITTIVISQLRDALNSPVPMKVRSGGRAVEFYSTIVVRLSTTGKIKRTIKGVERIIGTEVKVKCIKNKVAMPFRECTLQMIFGEGVDDLSSCLEWLGSTGKFGGLDRVLIDGVPLGKKEITKFVKKANNLPEADYNKVCAQVAEVTKTVWAEIEEAFAKTDDSDEAGVEHEQD